MSRPVLLPGDAVGILLASSPAREPFITDGETELRRLGWEPVRPSLTPATTSFFAATPEDLLDTLAGFWRDPRIRAVWAGRGGYGANRLLGELERLPGKNPVPFIGSSDASYLLWALQSRGGSPVLYGPMVYSTLAERRYDEASLRLCLEGRWHEIALPGRVILPGRVVAPLTGGCLTNFVSLLGTPFLPPTAGSVLLLEDVGERPYRLHRLLWQVAASGLCDRLSGLVLGTFPRCFASGEEREEFWTEVRSLFSPFGFPVIGEVPLGHAERTATIPLGMTIRLDGDDPQGMLLRGT
ncbi:MAG TPA: LD-carboxypeptidase [Candidatus Aminicenantes bacterium]|nr:LD-carboxypeptidase [Candidatus Aminicenantes bacterium]